MIVCFSTCALADQPLIANANVLSLNSVSVTDITDLPSTFVLGTKHSHIQIDDAISFHFHADKSGDFFIQTEADDVSYFVIIVGNDGTVLNKQLQSRFPAIIYTEAVTLLESQDAWIIVGEFSAKQNKTARAAVFDDMSKRIHLNINSSELPIGHTKFASETGNDGTYRSNYFALQNITAGEWITIDANSKLSSFVPLLSCLDKDASYVEGIIHLLETDSESNILISPEHNCRYILLSQQNSPANATAQPKANLDIEVSSFPYDPRHRLYGMTVHYMSNPIFSFILGGVFAIAVSYFFYSRSRNTRRIHYEIEQIETVLASGAVKEHSLFDANNTEIDNATVCITKLSRHGSGHIVSTDILTSILLTFENAKRIITFGFTKSESSWDAPKLSQDTPNSLIVGFSSLEDGDFLRISTLCEAVEGKEIVPKLTGRVKDASIVKDRGQTRLIALVLAVAVILVIALPLTAKAIEPILNYLRNYLGIEGEFGRSALFVCFFGLAFLGIRGAAILLKGAWRIYHERQAKRTS